MPIITQDVSKVCGRHYAYFFDLAPNLNTSTPYKKNGSLKRIKFVPNLMGTVRKESEENLKGEHSAANSKSKGPPYTQNENGSL